MGDRNRDYVVIGLGAFGRTIATELARFGNNVLCIDREEKLVSQIAPSVTSALILDSSDETALREAGVDQYGVAVVAIGQDIEASILTVMNLKMLGLKKVWVKAMNRTHHRILTKIGADRVMLPEQDMGRHVAHMLNNPAVQDYVALGNGFSIVNLELQAQQAGKTLVDLPVEKFGLRLLGLMRGTQYLPCDSALQFEADDKLIVLGKAQDLRGFGEQL